MDIYKKKKWLKERIKKILYCRAIKKHSFICTHLALISSIYPFFWTILSYIRAPLWASWCGDLPPGLGLRPGHVNLCAWKPWWGTFAFCWLRIMCVDYSGCKLMLQGWMEDWPTIQWALWHFRGPWWNNADDYTRLSREYMSIYPFMQLLFQVTQSKSH